MESRLASSALGHEETVTERRSVAGECRVDTVYLTPPWPTLHMCAEQPTGRCADRRMSSGKPIDSSGCDPLLRRKIVSWSPGSPHCCGTDRRTGCSAA